MRKTIYQNKDITRERLNTCIREMAGCGIHDLPSERDLCTIAGGSRKVLRELLEELESSGMLVKNKYKREIVGINPAKKAVPLLFSSIGRNLVENRSWSKLWFALSELGPNFGVRPELVLVGWPHKKAIPALRKIEASPVRCLIVTNTEEMFEKNHFDFQSKFTIFTDEDSVARDRRNVISLDNREAGRIAARELYQAGYRRPALFEEIHDPPYLPFMNRSAGFIEECRKLGMPFSDADRFSMRFKPHAIKHNLFDTIKQAERIAKAGIYDSLFSILDERVPLICDVLCELRIHYGDIGIISLNGANTSMNYTYPFTVVSSGSREIAMRIIQSVLQFESGAAGSVGHVRITPSVLNQEFLYKKGNSKGKGREA